MLTRESLPDFTMTPDLPLACKVEFEPATAPSTNCIASSLSLKIDKSTIEEAFGLLLASPVPLFESCTCFKLSVDLSLREIAVPLVTPSTFKLSM